MSKLRRIRHQVDAGVTLVEILVTMLLLGVVGTLVTSAVINASHGLVHADDENKGLQDAKVILDRMGRDVREARGVVCDGLAPDPTCTYHLQLWVDSNSDYAKTDNEVITWRLEPDTDGEHYDVFRIIGTGASAVRQREASTLIVQTVFTYQAGTTIDKSQIVKMDLTYDARVGQGTQTRSASFTARLRNKGTS
jgi:prepilin-type N-terminal cleavage/methylation domain-containing protein